MPRALSADLRERVLRAHERHEGSQRVLAGRFGVSAGTVNGWLRQARAGRRAPLRPHGGPRPLGGTDPALLVALVAERGDATLAEYAERLRSRGGRRVSLPALCRALRRLGLGRKKRPLRPASRIVPTSRQPAWRGRRRSPGRSARSG